MSAPNASSSSSQLVAYAQDIDYTRTEGFKQFKAWYNVKNTRSTHNDPNGAYLLAETVYQAVKGLGCTLRSLNGLSLDNFISSGSVAACRCLKHLSLAPYYAAQMKRCTQKWDKRNDQGPNVRATLPPSTLFADRALLCREYSISEPNTLVETVSKYKGLH